MFKNFLRRKKKLEISRILYKKQENKSKIIIDLKEILE